MVFFIFYFLGNLPTLWGSIMSRVVETRYLARAIHATARNLGDYRSADFEVYNLLTGHTRGGSVTIYSGRGVKVRRVCGMSPVLGEHLRPRALANV
jgi:hypothetical protein